MNPEPLSVNDFRDPGIGVLDHGNVKLIGWLGSDEAIIESARMSTDGAFKGWDKDLKLLTFLYKNKHMTPFEMCEVVFEIKLPIFVVREWHRHRTQSYNEMSGRYIPIPDKHYIPTVERIMMNGGMNKQAVGIGDPITKEMAQKFRNALSLGYNFAQTDYENALNAGVPKELARLIMPVGRYTKMRAKANLRNWLQFLTLRDAPNAQWEIQQYAKVIEIMLNTLFPRTMTLYKEGRALERLDGKDPGS